MTLIPDLIYWQMNVSLPRRYFNFSVTRIDDFKILFTFYLVEAFVRITFWGLKWYNRGKADDRIIMLCTNPRSRERIRGWNKFIRTKALYVITVVVASSVSGNSRNYLKIVHLTKHTSKCLCVQWKHSGGETRRLTERQLNCKTRSWRYVVDKQKNIHLEFSPTLLGKDFWTNIVRQSAAYQLLQIWGFDSKMLLLSFPRKRPLSTEWGGRRYCG